MTAIGWGANQFAATLSVYQQLNGFTESAATLAFAAYVIGLVPGLLGAAWISQHRGKRWVMRPMLVLSLVATVLLLVGATHAWAVFAARLLAGLATGSAMGPGTAWIKELCAHEPVGTGARRATIALTTGFGGGPLVSGALAYLLPLPLLLPYLPHLLLGLLAAAVAWGTPEIDRSDHPTPRVGEVTTALAHRWFWLGIVPVVPWVFGSAAMSMLYLAPRLAGPVPTTLAAGLAAGLTLGTGVLVQPTVRRFEARHPGRTLQLGVALLALGLVLGALALVRPHPAYLLVVAPLLGSAYGTLMVGGLTAVEQHLPLSLLAPGAAVYYCFTYVGFFAPFVISLLPGARPVPVLVVATSVALMTLLGLLAAWTVSRRRTGTRS